MELPTFHHTIDGSFLSNFTGPSYYPSEDTWHVVLEQEKYALGVNVEDSLGILPFCAQVLIFSRCYYWLATLSTIAYLLVIWLGGKYMKNRKPFNLRTTLKYWNLGLAVFSLFGCIRVLPHTFLLLRRHGLSNSMCSPSAYTIGHGIVGFWVVLFVLSKYLELMDTVFIVLRKRNLSFLHWYHHASVLVYSWHAFSVEQPVALFYCAMNYLVHSIMYYYYYLAAKRPKPPRWAPLVTILQIIQMFFGIGLTLHGLWLTISYSYSSSWTLEEARQPALHGKCFIAPTDTAIACLLYFTYLCLFAKFFFERYIRKPTRISQTESSVKNAGLKSTKNWTPRQRGGYTHTSGSTAMATKRVEVIGKKDA